MDLQILVVNLNADELQSSIFPDIWSECSFRKLLVDGQEGQSFITTEKVKEKQAY